MHPTAADAAANSFGTTGPVSLGAITIGIDKSETLTLTTTANITGVAINNSGTIDGTRSGIAIDNSTNGAPIAITNSGLIKGNVLFGTGGDQLTLTGGTIQTPNLAVINSPPFRAFGLCRPGDPPPRPSPFPLLL